MAEGFIGGGLLDQIELQDDEVILAEAPCWRTRGWGGLVAVSGKLYLTTTRLIWLSTKFPFALLGALESVTIPPDEVRRVDCLPQLRFLADVQRWSISTPTATHEFFFGRRGWFGTPYRDEWVDLIKQWAVASESV